MAGETSTAWRFEDAQDSAHIDLPGVGTAVRATFSGDSVRVVSTDKPETVLFEVPQLYSTIDADRSRLEVLPEGIRLHLVKLVPGEAWPQLTASDAESTPNNAPGNPLLERKAVEGLLRAAQEGDVEAFNSSACHFGSSDLSAVKDGNERTALHFAAASGQAEFCRYLLTEKGFEANLHDATGETALALAAGTGNVPCMKFLLDHGALAAHTNSKGGPQAIHRAAASGNMSATQLLLEQGADVNAISSAGPPLLWAAGEQQEEMAVSLMSCGADINAVDEKNVSACLMAAATGSANLLEELIKRGADVNIAADGGVSALHVAAESGNMGVVQSLLKAGADPNAKEQAGARPIDVAASAQHREMVELLLPCTAPGRGQEWSVAALMEHAAATGQHDHQQQHGGCCGCDHEHHHHHVEEQVDIPDAEDPDEAKGSSLKRRGDEAFVKGDYSSAAEAYTQALKHTTSDHAIWANRSAARLRLGAAEDALQDARRARTLKPDLAKAYYREGSALQALERWEAAAQAFFEGFRMDPQNEALAKAFQQAVRKAREENAAGHKHS